VLVSTAGPEQGEACSGQRSFGALHHLALVCDDDVLESRLRARPAWRRSDTAEVI
jgi:hypothetical protein